MTKLAILVLLLVGTVATTAQTVTVQALGYTDITTLGRMLFTHSTKEYSLVTVSNQPGKTFTLAHSDYRLDPGHTYTGEWTKNGRKLKVHAVMTGYYRFNKRNKPATITFKVVGQGIADNATGAVAAQTVPMPKQPCTRPVFNGRDVVCEDK